jgi:hypothetical protein
LRKGRISFGTTNGGTSEVEEKGANFLDSHICGMAQAMEADVPFCPINISALGAEGVMLVADASAQLIEQTWLFLCYGFRHALFHVYLMLYKCTAIVPRLGAVRFAGNQTNLHNGSRSCITA